VPSAIPLLLSTRATPSAPDEYLAHAWQRPTDGQAEAAHVEAVAAEQHERTGLTDELHCQASAAALDDAAGAAAESEPAGELLSQPDRRGRHGGDGLGLVVGRHGCGGVEFSGHQQASDGGDQHTRDAGGLVEDLAKRALERIVAPAPHGRTPVAGLHPPRIRVRRPAR
jgi:hypothetical protein